MRITIDLETQRLLGPDGRQDRFEIEPEAREMLLEGLDAIDLTMKHREQIDAFLRQDRELRPWIYLE